MGRKAHLFQTEPSSFLCDDEIDVTEHVKGPRPYIALHSCDDRLREVPEGIECWHAPRRREWRKPLCKQVTRFAEVMSG